jgi:hypothetical protein
MSSRSSSRSSSKGDSATVLRETGSSPGGELNVANIVEQQKIQNLREDLAKDTESNSKQGTATYSEPETVVSDMTFEEWKMVSFSISRFFIHCTPTHPHPHPHSNTHFIFRLNYPSFLHLY